MKKYSLKIKDETREPKYVLVKFENEKELKEWLNIFYKFEKNKNISHITFEEIFKGEENEEEF